MKKITFFKWMLLVAVLLIGNYGIAATVEYTGDFSNSTGASASYSANKVITLNSQTWFASYCYQSGTEFRLGHNKSAGVIPAKFFSNSPQGSSIEMQWDIQNVKSVSLVCSGTYGTVSNWYVFESTDAGTSWVQVATGNSIISTWSYTALTPKSSARYAFVIDGSTPRAILKTVTIETEEPGSPTTPSILVTEPSVPEMTAEVGATDTETLTISGANLTGNISLALTGDDAGLFELSQTTIAPTDGTVSDVAVTITYTPVAAGSHAATLTLSSADATDVVRELTASATWPPLSAPLATPASGISTTSFTANWDAVNGATGYEVSVYTKEEGSVAASDLFISEYVEGSSSNKYIEIFNGTGSSADLSDYKLQLFANGASLPTNDNTLTGILADGETIVYKNSNAALTLPNGVSGITNTAINYNGDDAIALFKISTGSFVDIFGVIGNDPGANWSADGGYTSVDKTLRRKSSVVGGITENPSGTGPTAFTTLGTEWDLYDIDDVTDLGTHTFDGAGSGPIQITGSPFTVTGENSKQVTGLTNNTTYYYTVVAYNENVTSEASSEITVMTSISTGVDNPVISNIYVSGSSINFSAKAGELVEVYNAVGQKLVRTMAADGLNSVQVGAKGVMMVKVGDKIAKVIL